MQALQLRYCAADSGASPPVKYRRPSTLLSSIFGIAVGAALLASAPVAHAVVPNTPTIEGPITGPGPMHPGFREGPAGTNPADFGYISEEYFASGTAGPDNAPYKVRVLVFRPKKIQKFEGTVIYEPTHRGGNALIFQFARYGILQRGYIGVTVGARAINLTNPTTPAAGLKTFNPDRYGSLQVADNQTNDILAQVAWMIKSRNPKSPLGAATRVKGIVMGGTSDSSGATRSYMANAHNTAFRTPSGGPIADGFFISSTLGTAPVEITDVPTIQMPTQFELASSNAWRRPDSDTPSNRFRIFEVTGMSHNDSRDQPADIVFPGCGEPLSRFPYGPMTFMGLQWVVDWAFKGRTPPHAQPMEVLAGPPRQLVLDQVGNVKGGVRTPHTDVPLYRYITPNTGPGLCSQSGRQERIPDDVLKTLYKNRGIYTAKFLLSLHKLERAGFWPKEYTLRYGIADLKDY